MVTGDKREISYSNVKRERLSSKDSEPAQMVSKAGLPARMVLLCIRRDWQGIIHLELPIYGQTLNSELNC